MTVTATPTRATHGRRLQRRRRGRRHRPGDPQPGVHEVLEARRSAAAPGSGMYIVNGLVTRPRRHGQIDDAPGGRRPDHDRPGRRSPPTSRDRRDVPRVETPSPRRGALPRLAAHRSAPSSAKGTHVGPEHRLRPRRGHPAEGGGGRGDARRGAGGDRRGRATSTRSSRSALDHAGDRSPLALANREIGALPPQARKEAGQRVGQARGAVNQALAERAGGARGRGTRSGCWSRRPSTSRCRPDRRPRGRPPPAHH